MGCILIISIGIFGIIIAKLLMRQHLHVQLVHLYNIELYRGKRELSFRCGAYFAGETKTTFWAYFVEHIDWQQVDIVHIIMIPHFGMKSFKNSASKPSKPPDMVQNLPMIVQTTALHTGKIQEKANFACTALQNVPSLLSHFHQISKCAHG